MIPFAEQLRRLVEYDPETGVMTWRSSGKGHVTRAPVGAKTRFGYVRATVAGERHHVHRLAWLYVHGEWPRGDIDHVNGDRADNRIANLREASRAQNNANAGPRRQNKTGLRGVSRCPTTDKWRASITINGRSINLGRHATAENAARAYDDAARSHHGAYAKLNFPGEHA